MWSYICTPNIPHFHLSPPFAQIELHSRLGVDGIPLVRVDNNNKETRVGVDHLGLVTSLQVPEDRSIIEEGQVDHVLALLKLWRIYLCLRFGFYVYF